MEKEKGESLLSLSLLFFMISPCLSDSIKDSLCICSHESSGFPFWSDDYRRLPPRGLESCWSLCGAFNVQRYAPSKGVTKAMRRSAFAAAGEQSEEMILNQSEVSEAQVKVNLLGYLPSLVTVSSQESFSTLAQQHRSDFTSVICCLLIIFTE